MIGGGSDCGGRGRADRRAMTLLEILVAMGILVGLGLSLMLVLRGGLATWTKGEARRESSQVAQIIFSMLREDLSSAYLDRPTLGRPGPVETRLIGDFDQVQLSKSSAVLRQRLFLTRTIKAESENPVTGSAGSSLHARGVVDFHLDRQEALSSNLRATGGLMEIGWVLGYEKRRTLYRLVRSPIGGPWSLFNLDRLPAGRADPARDAVIAQFQEPLGKLPSIGSMRREGGTLVLQSDGKVPPDEIWTQLRAQKWFADFDKAARKENLAVRINEWSDALSPQRTLLDARLETWGRPVASDVLFLGFEYWHTWCKSWDGPERAFRRRREHPSLTWWDSTRALMQPEGEGYTLFRSRASLSDPADDLLPSRVRVTLVLAEDPRAGSESVTTAEVSETATEIRIQEGGRAPEAPGYVLIDDEWIRYGEVRGDTLIVDEGGRGARGTVAAKHLDGMPAIFGRQYRTIINLPTASEDWRSQR